MKKRYLSTTEAAALLGITREAVFKRIQQGKLPAIRVGRNYALDPDDLGLGDRPLSEAQKKKIEKAVKRAFKEYGEALKKLGDA